MHLWAAHLAGADLHLERWLRSLPPAERRRAEGIPLPGQRARWVAARGLLRHLLGGYLAMEPEAVRLEYGEHGKPAVAAPPPGAGLHFNLSHAGELALFAFTRDREVGIDVERVREVPRAERIVARILPPAEADRWRALPAGERLPAFFAAWTRLEALAKLRGDGVWRTLADDPGGAAHGASLLTLAPLPGYAAALAVRGEGAVVKSFQLPAASRQHGR